MTRCGQCGLDNNPGAFACARCGATLGGGGADEGARLAAMRAAAGRRNMIIYVTAGVAAASVIAYILVQNSRRAGEAAAKLNFAERWADVDKRETGQFWGCLVPGGIDVRAARTLDQVQGAIESAAAGQPNYSEHITIDCVPKIQHAASAAGGLVDPPAELKKPVEAYTVSLQHLQTGSEAYAENLKHRQGTKDIDSLIQEYGKAWHEEQRPTPKTIAYDKFLNCAVPGVAKLKDTKALLTTIAELGCYNKQKDPAEFMDRVNKDCVKLLEEDPKAVPSKTYSATLKKLYEPQQTQLEAWKDCGKRARKGRKANDLGELLAAFGEYMDARKEFGQKAKEIQDSLK
jgi:hypothetical protein